MTNSMQSNIKFLLPFLSAIGAFLLSFAYLKSSVDYMYVDIDRNHVRIGVLEQSFTKMATDNAKIVTILEFNKEQLSRIEKTLGEKK
jgi:hypothetical protein